LGHVALEPDTYLSARVHVEPTRKLDIWSFGSRSVQANHVLVDLWRPHLTVWPSWMVDRLIHAGEIVKALQLEVIPGDIFGSHRWDETGPFLRIPLAMETRCVTKLRQLGVPEDARICCLIVRDDGYWSNDNKFNLSGEPRNRSIEEFETAARVIAESGFWVFRMGERVRGTLAVNHPQVFDYANSSIQSKEMDVFLLSRCSFAFSSLTGPAAVALAFRRPVYYFDVTLLMQCFHGSRLVAWNPADIIESSTGKTMSLADAFQTGVAWFRTMDEFKAAGVTFRNSDAQELGVLAREAVDWSSKQFDGVDRLSAGQRDVQQTLTVLMRDDRGRGVPVRSVLSQHWLDNHPVSPITK
jgi:putative glycosyltransferase (TIGR04372 family)